MRLRIPPARTTDPDPVSLTRMAAQHLYAPERLLRVPDGVYRTPVRQANSTALFHGRKVEATPLIAWRAGELYITAVKLRNLTSSELILDPGPYGATGRRQPFSIIS